MADEENYRKWGMYKKGRNQWFCSWITLTGEEARQAGNIHYVSFMRSSSPGTVKFWQSFMLTPDHVWLSATLWTVAYQALPSMGFSRQEYWSGLPFPSPGDLPNPGIEPWSSTLQADALTSEPAAHRIQKGHPKHSNINKMKRQEYQAGKGTG